jgi:hypothetical protein
MRSGRSLSQHGGQAHHVGDQRVIPAITDALVAAAVQTPGMLRAGQVYARQGRVSDLDIDEKLMMATAHVRGSLARPYWTSVIFPEDGDATSIESECTCPVGYGCKHVAAVLFVMLDIAPQRPGLRIIAEMRDHAPQARGALSDAVGAWIDRLAVEDLGKRAVQDDVCFVIEPKPAFKGGGKAAGRAKMKKVAPPARYLLQIKPMRKGRGSHAWQPFHPYELNYGRSAQVGTQALRLLARMAPVAAGVILRRKRCRRGVMAGNGSARRWMPACCVGRSRTGRCSPSHQRICLRALPGRRWRTGGACWRSSAWRRGDQLCRGSGDLARREGGRVRADRHRAGA